MDRSEFWDLLQACRDKAGLDSEQAARLIWRRLRRLSPNEVTEFQRLWDEAVGEVHVWPVRDAASLLLGKDVDEVDLWSVEDWIVSHGRVVVDRVLDDADNLADLVADRAAVAMDWFAELPTDVLLVLTGSPGDAWLTSRPEALGGTPVDMRDDQAVRDRFPRLMAYLDANPWIKGLGETQ